MPEIIDLEDWVPPTGFLRRYCEWTATHEGPLRFQFWTALTILAAAVGRRYHISKGFYSVFPNLYTLLIAPTGRCRKTRTSAIGISLLERLGVRMMSTKFTPEDLISRLESIEVQGTVITRCSEGFLYSSELTVMLGKQRYNEGLIDLLTDFADAPDYWSYSTRGGGKIELSNVCLVLLGCSTSEWLGDAIPQRAFGGGFLARIIFVVQHTSPRFFAIPQEQDQTVKNELVHFLQMVRDHTGTFVWDHNGERWYKRWYDDHRDVEGDLRLNGYFERKPDHVLRVAMLLALAEEAPLVLTERLLRRAEAVLEAVEEQMPEALREINTSTSGKDSNRILQMIRARSTGLEYEELISSTLQYMSPKSTDEALRGLMLAGKVDEVITPQGRKYAQRSNGHATEESNTDDDRIVIKENIPYGR